jgi:hypothetical protein
MPNITEYRARTDGLQPQEVGAEAFAQAGRRVGSFYAQMGQDLGRTVSSLGQEYQKHVTFQEMQQNGPVLAQSMVNLTKGWNNALKAQIAGSNQTVAPPAVPASWVMGPPTPPSPNIVPVNDPAVTDVPH